MRRASASAKRLSDMSAAEAPTVRAHRNGRGAAATNGKLPATMPLGQFLFEYLHRRGVRHSFGVPGDFALPTFAWLEKSKIESITMTHEPGAGFASDTNRVTVLTREGETESWPLQSKNDVAARLVALVAARLSTPSPAHA